MVRLIATTRCPTIDAELAAFGDVVLRADTAEIVLLRYSARFRTWYACGCPSVTAAERLTIPEAQMYWKRVGYVEDASHAYTTFVDKPAAEGRAWNTFYDNLVFNQARPGLP